MLVKLKYYAYIYILISVLTRFTIFYPNAKYFCKLLNNFYKLIK